MKKLEIHQTQSKKFKFLNFENNFLEGDNFITLRNNLIKTSNFIKKKKVKNIEIFVLCHQNLINGHD